MKNLKSRTTARHFIQLVAGTSLAALIAQGAMAQDAEEEADDNVIIVTATKRDANLQDIPFSINAQTAADIQRSGAVTLEDLSRCVCRASRARPTRRERASRRLSR